MRRPARTARSASSSCADGRAEDGHDRVADELLDRAAVALDLLPQARVVRADAGADVLRVSCSEAAVKPTRSQKSTVTTLRSSSAAARGCSVSGAAQKGQNGNSPGSSLPQEGQIGTRGVYDGIPWASPSLVQPFRDAAQETFVTLAQARV